MSGKKMYGQYGQPVVRRASFTAATARPTVSIMPRRTSALPQTRLMEGEGCKIDGDCPDPLGVCKNGKCVQLSNRSPMFTSPYYSAQPGGHCHTNSQCPSGYYCKSVPGKIAGRCTISPQSLQQPMQPMQARAMPTRQMTMATATVRPAVRQMTMSRASAASSTTPPVTPAGSPIPGIPDWYAIPVYRGDRTPQNLMRANGASWPAFVIYDMSCDRASFRGGTAFIHPNLARTGQALWGDAQGYNFQYLTPLPASQYIKWGTVDLGNALDLTSKPVDAEFMAIIRQC